MTKPSPLWYADDVPRAVTVACQRVRVRSTRWARFLGEDVELVCGAGQTEERGQETGGATDPETRELAHSQ